MIRKKNKFEEIAVLIQSGYESNNWSDVIKAYKILTNKDLQIKERAIPSNSKRQFVNLFVDDGSHKADSTVDKILWGNREPTSRNRKMEEIELECKSCHKTFTINKKDAPPSVDKDIRYICPKCSSRKNI